MPVCEHCNVVMEDCGLVPEHGTTRFICPVCGDELHIGLPYIELAELEAIEREAYSDGQDYDDFYPHEDSYLYLN